MPSTLTSTGITFSDGNSQNTAAGGGVVKKRVELYDANATHTIASGTNHLEIHAIGGGSRTAPGNSGGGAGGGYAYALINKSTSIPNVNSFAVNIGAGGSTVNQNSSNQAGATSVGGYVVANGGNGANRTTNAGSGGNGGTGSVNFSSPIDSATGTGGNGGGGNYNATGSGINGNKPNPFGGGGGGKIGSSTGLAADGTYPIPAIVENAPANISPGLKAGQGGGSRGGDGLVVIIEYGDD